MTEKELDKEIKRVWEALKPPAFKCQYCGKYVEGIIPFQSHESEHFWQTAKQLKKSAGNKPIPKPKVSVKASEELKRLLKSKNTP